MGDRMIDREKVIHGLSSCGMDYGVPNICGITECPYQDDGMFCVHHLAHDALALLKAQNPLACWVEEPDRVNHWHCSNCGCVVGLARAAYKYCYNCGAKIIPKGGEKRE